MALTKLTKNLIDGTFGTEWVSTIQTSNFTAEAAKGYFVNTTAGTITVNLPAGAVGTEIVIQDYAGTFATNKVLLNPNGSEKIQGNSSLQGQITTNNATATLVYQDATKGWTSQDVTLDTIDISWGTPTGQGLTYTVPSPQSSSGYTGNAFPTTTFTATISGTTISGTANFAGLPSGITATQSLNNSNPGNVLTVTLGGVYPSADSLNTIITLSGLTLTTPLVVDYLVVAGGGGTRGDSPGGGGAGGLRTSYGSVTGGGGSAESSITLSEATNYAITVGGGGAAATSGNDSVFYNITSVAGGRGGGSPGGSGNVNYQGATGGSGGGGAGGLYNASGGSGTTNQGYAGGTSGGVGGSTYPGGGGGGAGAVGVSPSGGQPGGSGGIGISPGIINATNATSAGVGQVVGSDVYFAGGGGGTSGGTQGTGGTGGGGNGGSSGTAGTPNTGGGGGGSNVEGGSGVVILRYPSAFTVSGMTQSAGSPFTEGSSKVSVFKTGTGNIQFN